jgi:succinate dehydrogenase/fumarate reductase flavoprotein subunit
LNERAISGALFLDMYQGHPLVIEAPAVVLSTGGANMVYGHHTDNTREATGDGMAMALQACARWRCLFLKQQ